MVLARTYKVVNMAPEEAHGVFDGPACATRLLNEHMRRLVEERFIDASMRLLPRKVKPLYGSDKAFPPYGFRMRLILTWDEPTTQDDIDEFNYCLTLSHTDRVGDKHIFAVNLEPMP